MCDTPAMLRELNVIEQRYQAVLEVLEDIPVTEVAERFGVSRQTVHRWVARYRESGLAGLADRSHAPKAHPWRLAAEGGALGCALRTAHPGRGARAGGPRRSRRGSASCGRLTGAGGRGGWSSSWSAAGTRRCPGPRSTGSWSATTWSRP